MGIDENIKAEGGSAAGDDKTIQLTVKSQTGEITKFKVCVCSIMRDGKDSSITSSDAYSTGKQHDQ